MSLDGRSSILLILCLLFILYIGRLITYDNLAHVQFEATSSYKKIQIELLEAMTSDASGIKTENGFNYVKIEKIKNIVSSRGAVEIYIKESSIKNGFVDLTIPEALIVRLQDKRYWFLYYPDASHKNHADYVFLREYKKVELW